MEVNSKKLSERILQLTLEIIYLLTGEDNIVVKKTSGDGQNPIMVPLHSLLIPERNNDQKILEITKRLIDLLTDENGNWCNINFRIKKEMIEEEEYSVMKERECLGQKDLYKDVMMENQPPLTSPMYPQNSTQEDATISLQDQSENWSNVNIIIKQEIKEEEDEYNVMKEWECLSHKDLYKDVQMEKQPPLTSPDGSSNRNPPEMCPHPLYSQDSTQEDHTIPHHDQDVDVFDIKTEVKAEEETDVKGSHPSVKEDEMMVTVTKEESSLDVITDPNKEDNTMAQCSPGVSVVTQNIHPKLNHMERSSDQPIRLIVWGPKVNQILLPQMSTQAFAVQISPSNCEESSPNNLHPFQDCEKRFPCSECEKSFKNKSYLAQHQRVHTGEKPFVCSHCGKCFSNQGNRDKHMRIHTGERPFSCSKCGKCFAQKVTLIKHQKIHARRMIP